MLFHFILNIPCMLRILCSLNTPKWEFFHQYWNSNHTTLWFSSIPFIVSISIKIFPFQIGFSGKFLKYLCSSSLPHQNSQPRSNLGVWELQCLQMHRQKISLIQLLGFMDLPS